MDFSRVRYKKKINVDNGIMSMEDFMTWATYAKFNKKLESFFIIFYSRFL